MQNAEGGVQRRTWIVALTLLASLLEAAAGAQPPAVTPEALQIAIDRLGDFDYEVRLDAARTIRRAAADAARAALADAVGSHDDSYVQFKALVLLYGFGAAGAAAPIAAALDDPNDRLRAVAYEYFELDPDPAVLPRLMAALDRETSEFVRPALVRALAAHGSDPNVRATLVREIDRGEDFFRSVVIEALGDYRATYALEAVMRIAAEDGPLQDDAVLALGKIGDRRAQNRLADLQSSAPPARQPVVSAAVCLLGLDCDKQRSYVVDALGYAVEVSHDAALVRNAATALAALALGGDPTALESLLDVGIAAPEMARAPVALAVGTVALRRPDIALEILERHRQLEDSLLLLRDAFDMLEEDLREERFFVLVREAYWESDPASPRRGMADAAMRVLEF